MEIFKLLLDKLTSLHFVVLYGICFTLVLFRNSISGFLHRLKALSGAGFAATAQEATIAASRQLENRHTSTGSIVEGNIVATSSSNNTEETNRETANRLQQLRNLGVPTIVQQREKLLQDGLQSLSISQEEKINILTRVTAILGLLLNAEQIYRVIFGSQIFLLKFLNISGVDTKDNLFQFYENAKAQFPAVYNNYSFERYLQYLLNNNLITTQDNEHYAITVAGKEFLKWITDNGLIENKPL